jgi:hypothetical protein
VPPKPVSVERECILIVGNVVTGISVMTDDPQGLSAMVERTELPASWFSRLGDDGPQAIGWLIVVALLIRACILKSHQ